MPYNIRRPLTVEEKNQLSDFPEILGHLLFHRGLTKLIQAQEFLNPDYELGSHDPFLMKDAREAGARLIKAIENKEKVAIYSDYDADGIPGAAIFHDLFKRIGFENFIIYIPHRHNEGFGVNSEAVKELASAGVKLMITVDCGIADIEPIKLAKKLGMDVIVTDHHQTPDELPPADFILDPKRPDCPYPDKNICGSAVGFKLIQSMLKQNRFGLKEGHEKWLLDLVGIATLSDMVPLIGENRIFAHYGLSVLRKSPRKGLVELFKKLKISQKHVTEDDIAFMITPRINAASRLGVPMDAFNLLSADDEHAAYEYANHLEAINNERKVLVANLVKEVKRTVKERYGDKIPSVIVLGNPEWRPSLLGLAANSCAEEFNRPVFLWGRDGEDMIKGSCRSEGISNVVNIMKACVEKSFDQFGGHHHSGGFSVSNAEIHYLEQRLNEAAGRLRNTTNKMGALNELDLIKPDNQEEIIDSELSLDAITWETHNHLNRLAPFGIGNPKPTFLFRKIIPETVRTFGKANDHVEMTFRKADGRKIPAIAFFSANSEWNKAGLSGKPIDLVASIEKSVFRGQPELRLRIIEVVPA